MTLTEDERASIADARKESALQEKHAQGGGCAQELDALLAIIDRLSAEAENTPEEDAAIDEGVRAFSAQLDERMAGRIVDATEDLWKPRARPVDASSPMLFTETELIEEARLYRREKMLRLVREEIAGWWEPDGEDGDGDDVQSSEAEAREAWRQRFGGGPE